MIFDKYEIVRRLAVGGMGEIFLARQPGPSNFSTPVIVKSLLPDLAAEKGFVEQFLEEAKIAATLDHPHTVRIHEVGEWEGTFYIAMEYIAGESVARLLQRGHEMDRPVPTAVAAQIIHDAALGLEHAHNATDEAGEPLSIVHRDISPQNIMVRKDGMSKVVDFGIAWAANRTIRTATGVMKGKLAYMPPEQLLGEQVDHRSDQFSLGVVFWELVTGQRMFVNPAVDLPAIQRRVSEPAMRPSGVADVPPELEAVIMRMLERDPELRFPSCAAVASELRTFLSDQETEPVHDVVAFVDQVAGSEIRARSKLATAPEVTVARPIAEVPSRARDTRRLVRPEPSRGRMLPALLGVILVLGVTIVLGLLGTVTTEPQTASAPSRADSTPDASGVATPKRVGPAVLVLTSTPAGAAVKVGQRFVGTTPIQLDTLPTDREQKLRLELEQHEPTELTVTLAANRTIERHVNLRRKKRPARKRLEENRPVEAAQPGFLSLTTEPWTKVSIDGRPVGSTPLYKHELRAGRHRLHLSNEAAGIDTKRDVVIPAGQTKKVFLDLN